MILVYSGQKIANLKYESAEHIDALDYMRAAMAAIRSGLPSSIHGNPTTYFLVVYVLEKQH